MTGAGNAAMSRTCQTTERAAKRRVHFRCSHKKSQLCKTQQNHPPMIQLTTAAPLCTESTNNRRNEPHRLKCGSKQRAGSQKTPSHLIYLFT